MCQEQRCVFVDQFKRAAVLIASDAEAAQEHAAVFVDQEHAAAVSDRFIPIQRPPPARPNVGRRGFFSDVSQAEPTAKPSA